MRTDRFRERYEMLEELARRRLAGFPQEADVALMVRFYQPRHEATSDALNKTQLNHVSKGDKLKIADMLGMQIELTLAGGTLLAIPLPKRKLTKAHLPKEFEGAEGEKNCAGRASLMAGLGPFFEMDKADAIEFEDVGAEEAELAADAQKALLEGAVQVSA